VYRLEISHTAHRQISKLPAQTRERVNSAIALLAENPRPPGVKKLTAREGYRLRIGNYRILYNIDNEAGTVVVYRVMPRENVYRF
jgi:mRNA interferase RelE/StbE